jgi:reverse gyrase
MTVASLHQKYRLRIIGDGVLVFVPVGQEEKDAIVRYLKEVPMNVLVDQRQVSVLGEGLSSVPVVLTREYSRE